MKHRLIAILLILLLLTVPFVTGVFAAPDTETEAPTDPVVTEPETEEPVVTTAPEPVVTEAPEVPEETDAPEVPTTEPAEPETPPTEPPATEPQEPVIDDPIDPSVISCTLTITRPASDADQDFLYLITGGESDLQIVLPRGETSVTVTGLHPGTYSVLEDHSWSWRYIDEDDPDLEDVKQVVFTDSLTAQTLRFDSERTVESWLTGSARGEGR